MGRARYRISPRTGSWGRFSRRNREVFPAPEGPTSAIMSPCGMSTSTPSSTVMPALTWVTPMRVNAAGRRVGRGCVWLVNAPVEGSPDALGLVVSCITPPRLSLCAHGDRRNPSAVPRRLHDSCDAHHRGPQHLQGVVYPSATSSGGLTRRNMYHSVRS